MVGWGIYYVFFVVSGDWFYMVVGEGVISVLEFGLSLKLIVSNDMYEEVFVIFVIVGDVFYVWIYIWIFVFKSLECDWLFEFWFKC